jgi:hypothetical protein
MQLIQQPVNAVLFEREKRAVLRLDEAAGLVFLRFALRELEREGLIFPALLLDDWGREIADLSLYPWIQENGAYFPRAELFGFDGSGTQIQRFLRELELTGGYPCYVARERRAAAATATPVEAILISGAEVATSTRLRRPEGLERPLANAAVAWWAVNPQESIDLAAYLAPPNGGPAVGSGGAG